MSFMNRLGNCQNPYQGTTKKVLCVCSAGLLRSPTAAVVLSQAPFNHNTRAAGISKEYALVEVDDVLLTWANEIVCMSKEQQEELLKRLAILDLDKDIQVINLDIPDSFAYRDPQLMRLIKEKYNEF
jgi:predicted protein tyrosine phosphatase